MQNHLTQNLAITYEVALRILRTTHMVLSCFAHTLIGFRAGLLRGRLRLYRQAAGVPPVLMVRLEVCSWRPSSLRVVVTQRGEAFNCVQDASLRSAA